MGLPVIDIQFKTHAVTAPTRSQRGIVALIVRDAKASKTYKDISEVGATDFSAANVDYVKKAFLGTPTKVIVQAIAAGDDVNIALNPLKFMEFDYLAMPDANTAEVTTISTYIKSQRDVSKKTYKAVLANSASDHEGIINFTTGNIVVGGTTYTAQQYTARFAGLFAGLPFTRSSTYYVLPEVTSCDLKTDPDAAIDNGELILVADNKGQVKIGRGVNSLKTFTVDKAKPFSKIKIIEGIDQMRKDLSVLFADHYTGLIMNKYENKLMVVGSDNAYLRGLEDIYVLDDSFANTIFIDVQAQKNYLEGQGVDTSKMTDQQIKMANTGSDVFVSGNVKFLDAMEDIHFNIAM